MSEKDNISENIEIDQFIFQIRDKYMNGISEDQEDNEILKYILLITQKIHADQTMVIIKTNIMIILIL